MKKFYVTFGVQYSYEPHPQGWPHPDGYLLINAIDYEGARQKAFEVVGCRFSMCYTADEFADKAHLFPLGVLQEVSQ